MNERFILLAIVALIAAPAVAQMPPAPQPSSASLTGVDSQKITTPANPLQDDDATTMAAPGMFSGSGKCDHFVDTDNDGNMTKVSGEEAIEIEFDGTAHGIVKLNGYATGVLGRWTPLENCTFWAFYASWGAGATGLEIDQALSFTTTSSWAVTPTATAISGTLHYHQNANGTDSSSLCSFALTNAAPWV
jgi:hypothetical protein